MFDSRREAALSSPSPARPALRVSDSARCLSTAAFRSRFTRQWELTRSHLTRGTRYTSLPRVAVFLSATGGARRSAPERFSLLPPV